MIFNQNDYDLTFNFLVGKQINNWNRNGKYLNESIAKGITAQVYSYE